jgi:hypothetical protein
MGTEIFEFFRKFAELFAAQGAPPMSGGKWKKSSIRKIFIISLGHLWGVVLSYRQIFSFLHVHFKLSAV